VVMTAPPEFDAANKAVAAKDYAKALPLAKGVVDKFKGLPVLWAQQATSLLGDIYVALDKLAEAEAAYADFQKFYPGAGGVQSNVGMAGISLARKNYEGARKLLEPVVEKARESATPPPALAPAYSQAFYLLGQVAEAERMNTQALEYYLFCVTTYYHDAKSAAGARQKAADLRKNDPSLFLP